MVVKTPVEDQTIENVTNTTLQGFLISVASPGLPYVANELPALVGSEKQVKWADEIRRKAIVRAYLYGYYFFRRSEDDPQRDATDFRGAHYQDDICGLTEQSRAKFWIDNRDAGTLDLLEAAECNRALEVWRAEMNAR